MLSVFTQTLRGYRIGIGLTSLGLLAMALLIVYVLDAIGGLGAIRQFEQVIPEGMKALIKAQGGFATDANGFLASAYYRHPIFLVAVSAFVISVASGAVAREVERGTILVLLAAPIARWRFLTAKTGAMVAGVLVVLASAWVGTWLGSLATGSSDLLSMVLLGKVLLNTLALALAIGGYSLLISALSSDGGQTTALAAGVTLAMFFLDYLSVLWSPAEWAGPLSIFHYYDPLAIVQGGGVPWSNIGVLLEAGVAGFAAALVALQRRDIAR